MIYIFLKIAKIHYSCIRLCTKFCLNLRELFLRENVSPRKKRKKKKKDVSHRERRKRRKLLTEKQAERSQESSMTRTRQILSVKPA